jgi:hypothetical protein
MVQLPGTPILGGLVVFGDESARPLAYALAGAILLLELAQWVIAQAALRRNAAFSSRDVYVSRPLRRDERRLVVSGLVLLPVRMIVLLPIVSEGMFEGDVAIGVACWRWRSCRDSSRSCASGGATAGCLVASSGPARLSSPRLGDDSQGTRRSTFTTPMRRRRCLDTTA